MGFRARARPDEAEGLKRDAAVCGLLSPLNYIRGVSPPDQQCVGSGGLPERSSTVWGTQFLVYFARLTDPRV